MAEVLPLERRYAAYLRQLGRSRPGTEAVEVRWLLEELRMSVFAQPLGVGERVERATGQRAPHRPRRLTPHALSIWGRFVSTSDMNLPRKRD